MSSSPKIQRERKRQGLCVGCGGKPKAGCLRCESCLQKQRDYDTAWRARQKGATVEPQCKLPDGKMRAEHVFDEDGLCDYSARKMEFAPRPALRPEVLRAAAPKRAAAPARPAPAAPPAKAPAPPKPKSRAKRQTALIARPRGDGRPRAPIPVVEKHIGGTTFAALIADLERQRASYDQAIARLREIEEWWPR